MRITRVVPRPTRVAAVALAASVGLVVGPPAMVSPAEAHTSGYCGHGTDGIITITKYRYEVTDRYGHSHRYQHYTIEPLTGTTHSVHYAWKSCPRHG